MARKRGGDDSGKGGGKHDLTGDGDTGRRKDDPPDKRSTKIDPKDFETEKDEK